MVSSSAVLKISIGKFVGSLSTFHSMERRDAASSPERWSQVELFDPDETQLAPPHPDATLQDEPNVIQVVRPDTDPNDDKSMSEPPMLTQNDPAANVLVYGEDRQTSESDCDDDTALPGAQRDGVLESRRLFYDERMVCEEGQARENRILWWRVGIIRR